MLGAAADSVSSTLDSRRTRKELSDLELETKLGDESRAMDNEEELFRRKGKRLKKTEMENWIATINSYLPPDQAQKAILEFSNNGHKSVGVLAARLAALGDAGFNVETVLQHNRGLADPEKPNAQFLNLLATPVGKKDPKAKTTFQAMFTDISARKTNATSEKEFNNILKEEENVIADHLRWSNSLKENEAAGDDYVSRFNKEKPNARSFGDFNLLLKQKHGYDLSQTEEIRMWREGNKLTDIKVMVGHSRRLDEIEKMYVEAGAVLAKEPDWTASKMTFQSAAVIEVETYINDAYSTGDNLSVSAKDIANGFDITSPATYNKITTTSNDIQNNLKTNRNFYKDGAVVPFLSEAGFISSWVYTGQPSFSANIFLLGQSKD